MLAHGGNVMKHVSLMLLGLAAVLLLAGCPGKQDADTAPAASAAPPVKQEAQPPSAGANGLAAPPTAAATEESGSAPEAAPAAEGEAAGGETAAPPATGEEPAPGAEAAPGADDEQSAAEAGEPEAGGTSDETAPAAEEEAAQADDEAAADDSKEGAGDATAAEAAEDDVAEEPGAEAEAAEEEAAPASPIDQFKALDPREIIDRKYEDLQEQHTEPWNEEDPGFTPDTGRVDPLTRVREAVPEELKPPRAGETDENDIISYSVARDATMVAYSIAMGLECYNVIQIGIEKQATISIFGNTFLMGEGESAGPIEVGVSSGVPLMATLTCTSISENEVHINVTVYGDGTNTSISKSMVFIPKSWL